MIHDFFCAPRAIGVWEKHKKIARICNANPRYNAGVNPFGSLCFYASTA